MTIGKGAVEGSWKWWEQDLPRVSKYTYLGIDFVESGAWDVHIKKYWAVVKTSCILLLVTGTFIRVHVHLYIYCFC